jgi:hypothetical protein
VAALALAWAPTADPACAHHGDDHHHPGGPGDPLSHPHSCPLCAKHPPQPLVPPAAPRIAPGYDLHPALAVRLASSLRSLDLPFAQALSLPRGPSPTIFHPPR